MARTARLLELLITLGTRSRFTVGDLAAEFGVSRRTMLRDLQTLSELGVPLAASPGPGGGYALVRGRRLLPLALTGDEALGVLLSYEAFLQWAQSPFAAQNLSAITKLRAALPPDVVRELDRIRRHVAIIVPPRRYEAPLLGDLLRATLDGAHLRVVYDSKSGVAERVVFPFGLYASAGFWYCACFDYRRGMNLSLRADRFVSLAREEGLERPPHIPVADWPRVVERDDGRGLPLHAKVTARGMKSYDLQTLFGPIAPDGRGGGLVEGTIPRSEIDWYAARLLPVGPDLIVESPAELIAALRRKVREVAALYQD